ncbi:MAG: hypothetical protein JNM66_25615 [Bryobacterales bacterium]|nr:hypothetical protein [Bryobacterales bacterium]
MIIEKRSAQIIAAKIHPLFPQATPAAIEEMIDAGFWASLRREEGFTPAISLTYLPPEHAVQPILFDRRIPLQPASLARLAPAVERPGIHLGVSPGADGSLSVWGAIRALPPACFVLEVVAPGLLVVKQPGDDDSLKFANIVVLEGDQAKFLSTAASAPPDSPAIIKTLLGLDNVAAAFVELAVSMRKHRRGGALLVVPAASGAWRESIVHPMTYQIDGLGIPGIETTAGLTAVDGATIVTSKLELLAFGAKIARREGAPRVDQVAASELIEGAEVQIIHPTQLGGTRHLSAAQFVQDQRDAVALVASQDGHFTVFGWAPTLEMVQAFRIETFLL